MSVVTAVSMDHYHRQSCSLGIMLGHKNLQLLN